MNPAICTLVKNLTSRLGVFGCEVSLILPLLPTPTKEVLSSLLANLEEVGVDKQAGALKFIGSW